MASKSLGADFLSFGEVVVKRVWYWLGLEWISSRVPYPVVVVLGVGVVVAVGVLNRTESDRAKLKLLASPALPQGYIELAQLAAAQGDYQSARAVIALSRNGKIDERVLGEIAETEIWLEPIEFIENRVDYWSGMATQQPNYPESYLRLSYYNWLLERDELAREYLRMYQVLVPNGETGLESFWERN